MLFLYIPVSSRLSFFRENNFASTFNTDVLDGLQLWQTPGGSLTLTANY